jgi:molecular chaperone GrpE
MTKSDYKNNISMKNKNLSESINKSKSDKIKKQQNYQKENSDNLVKKTSQNNDETKPAKKDEGKIDDGLSKEEKLINYEEELFRLRDEKLRLLAEMENLRKRSEREKIESIKFGTTNLIRDILSPNDNLTRALINMPNEKDLSGSIKNLIDGLKMVQKEFTTILEKYGVKKIDALNKKFDHNLHQAMLEIEIEDKTEGIVVQEIQTGYTVHERLLRPTMVGVSKKPIKDSKKN